MRQLQGISTWQEYGGRRWETSQQHLSAYTDGWKTPDTRSSTSDVLRAQQTWCGRNSLCTSWPIMTFLPMKRTSFALVHLKYQNSKSTHLSIKAFYKYIGKKKIVTVFFVTSLWKKDSCLSSRTMNQQKNTLLQNTKHTKKKGWGIVSKVTSMLALCLWDSSYWRGSGNVFLSCPCKPKGSCDHYKWTCCSI